MPSSARILIYLLRRDLRLADNPIFHHLSNQGASAPFTHVLPLYILPANQIEVSGFLASEDAKSPYPEARSQVAGFWRCGPHRAKFLAESVWDVKESLEKIGSGLAVRVGLVGDVLDHMCSWYESADANKDHGSTGNAADTGGVKAIWMVGEEGVEEKREEKDARKVAESRGKEFKLWTDEKFFVDDRDLPYDNIQHLPDVYTSFRKQVEPLRSQPRPTVPAPTSLPPLPSIPPQSEPFTAPKSLEDMLSRLRKPFDKDPGFDLPNPPKWPSGTTSAHPFLGGESNGQQRIRHLIESSAMTNYKETRNGLLGPDFSTKLSAWLALGCITARQIHTACCEFEDGSTELGKEAAGYGRGENKGTAAVRFELLWRDYMRLCTRKFGIRLFNVDGFRASTASASDPGSGQKGATSSNPVTEKKQWHYLDRSSGPGDDPAKTREILQRFRSGRTGIGLIDASQRELFLTGYTSNRARQNVASFLSSHLGIDWRCGAEWYECMLADYDLSNNWGNWQYVAGVGNDPRQGRRFNPVKQALDYDRGGAYIKAWVPELRHVDVDGAQKSGRMGEQMLMGLFQAWRLPEREKETLGLKGVEWVERPLVRIPFAVGKGNGGGGGGGGGREKGRGGGGGGGGRGGFRGRGGRPKRLGNMDKAKRGGDADGETLGASSP